MQTQKHLFQLPDDVHYINCAYMSPMLKASEKSGIKGIQRKRNPALLHPNHFFDEVEEVKQKFGQIINADSSRVAIIPSASYGLMNAVQNVPYTPGKHALTIADEFPSGQFALSRWCDDHQAELKIVTPGDSKNIYAEWNRRILESITENTALVLMSSVHWMDGTLFKLTDIGQRCHEVGATFIVDGSQSVGALPINVNHCSIDVLVCAGYKWLLGPYSIGLAYYGQKFDEGIPIEESWMNRTNAQQFSQLTNYDYTYKSGAQRYSVGEASNFIHMPMLKTGLQQLLDWGIPNIQSYCKILTDPLIKTLRDLNFELEEDHNRAYHLFGLRMPDHIDSSQLMQVIKSKNISLSVRGNSIRVSPHLYNTGTDMHVLIDTLTDFIKNNK